MSISAEVATIGAATLWPSVGASEESRKIDGLVRQYWVSRRTPVSFAWRSSLVEEVWEILRTCSARGWDGYDAEPISSDSANGAIEFVFSMPEGVQRPAVVPEPDGDIALEWRTGDLRLFSVSVTGPRVVYAGIFGGSSRQYGEEPFFGALPTTILEVLVRYFPAV